MNFSKRTVFAGKGKLQPEPFCPFITDESGYVSLLRKPRPLAKAAPKARRSRR